MTGTTPQQVILFRAGGALCALPITSVMETLRPLPLRSVAGAPSFVLGVSIVRGIPVPIISTTALVAGTTTTPRRFVIVRAGDRRVGLAVDEVLGIASRDDEQMRGLPPLLDQEGTSIEFLGAADGELFLVLSAGRLVPPDTTGWLDMESAA